MALCKSNKGTYTFRAQGQIYHYIGDLIRVDGLRSYLYLYFHDTIHKLENCITNLGRLNMSIIA